jgi:uncharacterized protein YceH (UPF0502 family)
MIAHLIDHSRRIDTGREELSKRIDRMQRMDHPDLTARVAILEQEMADMKKRVQDLDIRVTTLEQDVADIKKRLAATPAPQE